MSAATSVLDGLTVGQRALATARAKVMLKQIKRDGCIVLSPESFANYRSKGWSNAQVWQSAEILVERGHAEARNQVRGIALIGTVRT